jgi:hypothetical protein
MIRSVRLRGGRWSCGLATRHRTIAAAALLFLAAGPAALGAQGTGSTPGAWSLDAGAGLGLPGGNLNEDVGMGPAGSAGVALSLGRHVSLRADLDVAFEGGKDLVDTFGPGGVPLTRGPDLTIFHYMLGMELFPVAPSPGAWWISAAASLGATSLHATSGTIQSGPWPTAGVTTRIGRQMTARFGVWAGVRAYFFVVGGSDDASFNLDFPVVGGVRVGL